MAIALVALLVGGILWLTTRVYMQVRAVPSRGVGLTLGSNEPPLFEAGQE